MGIHYYKGVTIANCKLLQWRFDRLNDHRSSLPTTCYALKTSDISKTAHS